MTSFDLNDDAQTLALGRALVALGFHRQVEAEWNDPNSIRDMLSDIDWYATRWEPGFSFLPAPGHHPIVGPTGRWHTYMTRFGDGNTVELHRGAR